MYFAVTHADITGSADVSYNIRVLNWFLSTDWHDCRLQVLLFPCYIMQNDSGNASRILSCTACDYLEPSNRMYSDSLVIGDQNLDAALGR